MTDILCSDYRYFGVTTGMRPHTVQSCFSIQSKAYPFNYLAVDFYRKPQGEFYLCFGFAAKRGHKKESSQRKIIYFDVFCTESLAITGQKHVVLPSNKVICQQFALVIAEHRAEIGDSMEIRSFQTERCKDSAPWGA